LHPRRVSFSPGGLFSDAVSIILKKLGFRNLRWKSQEWDKLRVIINVLKFHPGLHRPYRNNYYYIFYYYVYSFYYYNLVFVIILFVNNINVMYIVIAFIIYIY
jgi:hypothetical protein